MVDVVKPHPGETICDPACGTGGFLLAAHDYLIRDPNLTRDQKKKLKDGTFTGIELVQSVARLCAMNLQGRWRAYNYDELVARDKASLDIFWLKDESLEDSDNLPEPGVIAAEIVEDLESELDQMRLIAEDLEESAVGNV